MHTQGSYQKCTSKWCILANIDLVLGLSLLPYSRRFSNGANVRIFRMLAPYSKIKTAKI